MEDVEDEEDAMAAMMGFGGFGTTKVSFITLSRNVRLMVCLQGKKVVGNQEGGADIKKVRTWRQYMNRRGGFNRFVAMHLYPARVLIAAFKTSGQNQIGHSVYDPALVLFSIPFHSVVLLHYCIDSKTY
jgi:U4/U6.U5 small nuclear ribonucleoproteins